MYSPGLVCIKRNDYISLQWTLTLTRVPFVASGFRPVSLATCQPVALPLIGAVKTKVLNKRFVCVSKFCWSHGWLKNHELQSLLYYCFLPTSQNFCVTRNIKRVMITTIFCFKFHEPRFTCVSFSESFSWITLGKLKWFWINLPHKGVAHCHSQNRYTNQWAETSRPSTYDVRLACSIFRSKTVPLVRSKISQSEIFWQVKLLPYLFFKL